MRVDFARSDFGSLGVEIEGTLVDRSTGEPTPRASELVAEVQPHLLRGRVTSDFFASTLELVSGVCSTLDEARADLRNIWASTRPALEVRDAALLAMGLHPRAGVCTMQVLDEPRYQDLVMRLQWSALRSFTTGIHVHVGMPDGDTAVATAHALRSVLPILKALSAASPYRNGRATGLASTRTAVFDSVPRTGPMPHFDGWSDYARYVSAMISADSMVQATDHWWDCRLAPEYGTLEIRVMDSIAEIDDIMALVALGWCMSVGVEALARFMLPDPLNDDNRWRATRFGVNGSFVVDGEGGTAPVGDVVERLVDALIPTAIELGCASELHRCRDLGWGRARHQQVLFEMGGRENDATVEQRIDDALLAMRIDW